MITIHYHSGKIQKQQHREKQRVPPANVHGHWDASSFGPDECQLSMSHSCTPPSDHTEIGMSRALNWFVTAFHVTIIEFPIDYCKPFFTVYAASKCMGNKK
jgi:hypothetical protein